MSAQIDPRAGSYDEATCPAERCGESLHITWTGSAVLMLSDTIAELNDPDEAVIGGWEIGCTAGHVLLLPVNTPGLNQDVESFGAEPTDQDEEPEHDDLGRLRRALGVVL